MTFLEKSRIQSERLRLFPDRPFRKDYHAITVDELMEIFDRSGFEPICYLDHGYPKVAFRDTCSWGSTGRVGSLFHVGGALPGQKTPSTPTWKKTPDPLARRSSPRSRTPRSGTSTSCTRGVGAQGFAALVLHAQRRPVGRRQDDRRPSARRARPSALPVRAQGDMPSVRPLGPGLLAHRVRQVRDPVRPAGGLRQQVRRGGRPDSGLLEAHGSPAAPSPAPDRCPPAKRSSIA